MKKHALLIPLTLQGHVASMYRVAIQLARRGITITFVAMANDIPKMKMDVELQDLDFNLIPYDEALTQPTDWTHSRVFADFISKSGVHFKPILEELKAKKEKEAGAGPTCIIYDRFCTWAKDASEELNIPLYVFFSCGAINARFLQEFPRLVTEGSLRIKEDKTLQEFEGYLNVPGLPPLLRSDLTQSSLLLPELSLETGRTMANAEGMLVNTFYEMESPQIDEIRRYFAELAVTSRRKKTELFLIGPLSTINNYKDRSFTHKSGLVNRGAECLQWLDDQQPQSVLYICLGSMGIWSPHQVYELAVALEASKQSFLWVLQTVVHVSSLEEALPAGFEERTSGRGLIATGWVPQLQILAHTSVGGFLTHCGWNSSIESVSSGVPLICWPQGSEQHMNCRHFVEVLKIAVEVGRGKRSPSLVGHEEFERAFRLLMVSEEGKEIRSRVQDLKSKAAVADGSGGARHRALDQVVERIPGELEPVT